MLNIINELFIQCLVIYWNYTFWWEFSESTCIYFQYVRYFILISYGTLTTISQICVIIFYKKSRLTYIFQLLVYYSLPIGLVLGIPNINNWKLSVQKPSTILNYYRIQGIDIPKEVKSTIFSDLTIDAHFQCALPLQCLRRRNFRVQFQIHIWNKLWTMILPTIVFLYRNIFDVVKLLEKNTYLTRRMSHFTVGRLERNLFARMVMKLTNMYLILWLPYHVNQMIRLLFPVAYHQFFVDKILKSHGLPAKFSDVLHAFGQLYQIVVPLHYLLCVQKPIFVLIRMMKKLKEDVMGESLVFKALRNEDRSVLKHEQID